MSVECQKLDDKIAEFEDTYDNTSDPVEKARLTAKIEELKDRKEALGCP